MNTDDAPPREDPCERIGPIPCRACDLNTLCRLTGLIAYSAGRPRQATGALRSLRSGAALFRAGAPARALFAIRQGMVKLVYVNADGEEQIVSFHTPGEVVGLEAFGTDTYVCDAIASGPVQCCEVPVPRLDEQGAGTAEVAGTLVHLLGRAAAARVALARGSARERITNFLLDLSRRLGERGFDAKRFRLTMSRMEIANLLDARIETVSRILQQLHRERAIHVSGDRVQLLDLKPVARSAGPCPVAEATR